MFPSCNAERKLHKNPEYISIDTIKIKYREKSLKNEQSITEQCDNFIYYIRNWNIIKTKERGENRTKRKDGQTYIR